MHEEGRGKREEGRGKGNPVVNTEVLVGEGTWYNIWREPGIYVEGGSD